MCCTTYTFGDLVACTSGVSDWGHLELGGIIVTEGSVIPDVPSWSTPSINPEMITLQHTMALIEVVCFRIVYDRICKRKMTCFTITCKLIPFEFIENWHKNII